MSDSFSLFLFRLVLICAPVHIFSQNCTLSISGRVLDEHDQQPLALTEVYIRELNRGAVADSSGAYSIGRLCPGIYTVIASHIGCEPVVQKIDLRQDEDHFNFYPEHHTELLSEANIVQAKKRTTAYAEVKLSPEQIESARGNALDDLIENVSGVNTLKNGNAILKPVIHGLYGNRIVTLNQGVRQEDQQWGLEHGLNVDPFTAEQVSVIKGASAVRYGSGAVGGVLKLEAAELPYNSKKFSGKAYLIGNTNGRGGLAALHLEQGLNTKWAYRIQLTGQLMGDRKAPDYMLTNTGNREWNGAVTIGYTHNNWETQAYYSTFNTELGILRSAHIGNITDFEQAIERGEPFYQEAFDYRIQNPRQRLTHQLGKLKTTYEPNAHKKIELIYGIQHNQRLEYDIRRDSKDQRPANDLDLFTQTLELSYQWNPTPQHLSEWGLAGLLQVNSNNAGTGIRPLLPNYNRYEGGAFITHRYILSSWLWEAGLRYDRQYTLVQKFNLQNQLVRPEFSFNSLAASLGATYSFNTNWQLSSSLGYAYRPPHVNELMSEGLHHGAATIETGDSTLQPERSLNWSNTLSINYPGQWNLEITAYVNPFLNFIYLNPQQEVRSTIRGTFPVYLYSQDNAILSGVDLSGGLSVSPKLDYTLTGSYMRGFNNSDGDDLILMPAPQLAHSLSYHFKDLKTFKNNFLSISQKLVARQQHFPEEADLVPPPEGYNLIGISIGSELVSTHTKSSWAFTFSIENLFNTSYRDYLNRFRYYADQTGTNIQLKLKYEF
ncbi:MAG: TonB-dependent receptor [Owenweeksia sp.]